MRNEDRKIINVESVSIGKKPGENNDGIYVGENFVAVIDGVSNSSNININDMSHLKMTSYFWKVLNVLQVLLSVENGASQNFWKVKVMGPTTI